MNITQAITYYATDCRCVGTDADGFPCAAFCKSCHAYQADPELLAFAGRDCILATAIGRRVRAGYYADAVDPWAPPPGVKR